MLGDYQMDERMAAKLRAIRLPGLAGRTVLDIGCDHGFWSFRAARMGARDVLGLDRGREVRGEGFVDLVARCRMLAGADPKLSICRFEHLDLGAQWHDHGRFDVVLCMSVFHHAFASCGDLGAPFFWLRRHVNDDGLVIWEGPVDDTDPVVRANVPDDLRLGYTRRAILEAASRCFAVEEIGPALHEPTRFVFHLHPLTPPRTELRATIKPGAGGATAAFEHAGGRRIAEIEAALGVRPVPGSLNLTTAAPFDWESGYYRCRILDVVDRAKGLESEWARRWCRFYPLEVEGLPAHAMRFEGETYPPEFVELVSPLKLRDFLDPESAAGEAADGPAAGRHQSEPIEVVLCW